MTLFQFFQLIGVELVIGLMVVNFIADGIGVIAEKVADCIRQKAYEDARAEGLDHDQACERADERCPIVRANDVRANVTLIVVLSLIGIAIVNVLM